MIVRWFFAELQRPLTDISKMADGPEAVHEDSQAEPAAASPEDKQAEEDIKQGNNFAIKK